MDTTMSSDKSQLKGSERGNPHSPYKRQSQKCGKNPKRNRSRSDQRRRVMMNESCDFNEHGPNEKRYNPGKDYRSDRSHSNKGYHLDEFNHNRKYNFNRHWNQNSHSHRNKKWNNSGPKYGNRTWQRPYDDVFPEELDYQYLNESKYKDTNQGDFASDEPFLTPNEIFYQQRELDTQQIYSRSRNSKERIVEKDKIHKDRAQAQVAEGPGGSIQEKSKSQTQSESKKTNPNDNKTHKDSRKSENQHPSKSRSDIEHKKATQETSNPFKTPRNQNEQSSFEVKETESTKEFERQESTNPKDNGLQDPPAIETTENTHLELQHESLDPVEFENLGQEDFFIKTEPGLEPIESIVCQVKPEPQDITDSDFDFGTCLNYDTENHFPSISVIPISELIKSELKDISRSDIVAQSAPTRGRLTLRPNLVKRRKVSINEENSDNLSENLVQRVANMDKVGIKNVINNSGTKYDAALKIQARKRLREEIRKQLKSVNFTAQDNSQNSVLVPDEIVDSMNIPAVILDEIRKAFGIVLVEDMKVISDSTAVDELTTNPPQAPAAPPAENGSSKSPDLMSRLKMLEETKSQTDKTSPGRTAATPRKDSKSKTKDDVVIINSSSSSSSSSSSGSDSDSSSTSSDSNTSTTSSYKRRRRKKRILEANVVGNFEKLILPNLTLSQRRRYKEKYSKATKSSLQYIYGVCVSRAHQKDINIDPKEKLKLKRNLSSADNAQALEFLMKAILNLFEQQKEKRRMDKDKSTPSASTANKSRNRSEHSNPVNRTKKPNETTCNQRDSDDEPGREQTETAGTAKTVELPKHQSTTVDKKPLPSLTLPVGGVNRNDEDSIRESAKSAQGALLDDDGRLVARESDSESDLDNLASSEDPPSSRLWKSPGEKKCIEMESSLSLSGLNTFGSIQPPFSINTMDLDALSSQRTIGDEAVRSIREIDVKLMELHKRKMYIEEMILKLHKDKMEVDLWTMKLQNEKFILLNSALASASNNSAAILTPKTEKPPKRKPFSTPFSEKLRNRKKRCQRDILLEEASLTQDTSSDPSELMHRPRQTRSDSKSKLEEASKKEAKKNESSTKVEEVTAQEKDDDPPPSASEPLIQTDYTDVPNGSLEGWKLPITQIIVVGEAIVAASEDGNIYKFNIRTRELESKFSKHTEAITQIFVCPRENFVYTTSLDGFLKKTSIENFGLEIQSLNLQEPLQSIDIEWSTAFIGSRWGNIFTYSIKNNSLSESLLCSSGSSIIALKATKEGPRKVLIVSSKGNQINFRDAMSGLLLRSLDVPDNLHIYSILLDDGCVYCGTQRNEIHKYNFTTGGRLAIFQCGNGAVSMKMYKDKYIFVGCYDGFVYVLDKTTGCQIGRFPGSGKMILALDIAGDKLITSAKDNSMQIIDIPKYIVTKDKS